MHRIRLHSIVRSAPRTLPQILHPFVPRASSRCLHTQYEDKYSEKLRKAAEQRGLSVPELKAKIKLEQDSERQQRDAATTRSQTEQETSAEGGRKDSSPVKPLSSILNIPRILASPHTAEQIEALWTVYHASRSNGTGRGYLCASIPLDVYTKMAGRAAKYPIFVVPVRRDRDTAASPPDEGESDAAHEFYFLQWAFHDAPPIPSLSDDLFSPPPTQKVAPPSGANPQISTIMFTPLQEYKMRGSFATPYLVLTNYTDLAHSHGVVLLRGEITPSAATGTSGVDGRYLLRQEDAHRLSMSVQNFYLPDGDGSLERQKLVEAFHETPNDFEWEKLLKHGI
ncbi:ATP11 protein-domain-containing protein [Mycena galopus ATCC 62051]|nr:ATP11 protein-domain-containing protein [Mycena galopus ATCC 62051]